MSSEKFWTIIEASSAETQSQQTQKLTIELSKLSKDELISFETSYREKLRQAYHWDLWAGAYIINGGCSDDGFDYFCDWLISRGQNTFKAALENPETLIEIAKPWDTEFEDFRYIMMDVMTEQHQSEFPKPTKSRPSSPAGEDWDEDTVYDKFPKLSKWVGNSSSTAAVSPTASSPKVSFWKRLFGK